MTGPVAPGGTGVNVATFPVFLPIGSILVRMGPVAVDAI